MGARAELDICTPPALLGQLLFRPCLLGSPAYVAGGDGSNLSFGLRLEFFAQGRETPLPSSGAAYRSP